MILKSVAAQVLASGPAQASHDDVESNDILMDGNATFLGGNVLEGSDFGSWSSEERELGSPFSWVDESSDDDLDYFAMLDLAALESPLRSIPREVLATSTDARVEGSR
jgi:hypothetical protein